MMVGLDEKRIPYARWVSLDINFSTADADKVIPHQLRPQKFHEVRYEVIDQDVSGRVYRGIKAPGIDFIVLRASAIGNYRVRLFIEAHVENTEPL